MKNIVFIEYVQNNQPGFMNDEGVIILNNSKETYDLDGWELIYEDLTGDRPREVHTHRFYKLRGTFLPGERLCVISGNGLDRFMRLGKEKRFPVPHWDLFTDQPVPLLRYNKVRVKLINEQDMLLDSMTLIRFSDQTINQEKKLYVLPSKEVMES